MKIKLAALIILAMTSRELPAQTALLAPASPFTLDVDFARFRNDAGSGYLEIYYGFHPQLLTYHFQEGKFHAGVKLQTRITNALSQAEVALKKASLRIAENDTAGAWYRYPFVTQAGFMLPHGEYKLEITATDSLAGERQAVWTKAIDISAYPAAANGSDIELCKNIAASSNQSDLFFKNSMEVVPYPSLVYGTSTAPVLYYYVELYHLQPATRYHLKTSILRDDGGVARESSKPRQFRVAHAAEVGTINLTTLPSGKYFFRFVLQDSSLQSLHQAEKSFLIYNPHIPMPQAQPPAASAQQLLGLPEEQLDLEFRQARYLATKDEIKFFAALTSVEGKRDFLEKFWQAIANGRGDFLPVTRRDYLRRIKIVNERYAALGKDGWETNRGRIYLLYGEPDEIERRPVEGGKPHEVWSYYSIENGVEFVFVNRFATGDYDLVHSTKRGELQDPNWQRFIN